MNIRQDTCKKIYEKFYKLLGKDLSKQINTRIAQQINFIGKLEDDTSVTKFFVAEKQQKTVLNSSLDSLKVRQ